MVAGGLPVGVQFLLRVFFPPAVFHRIAGFFGVVLGVGIDLVLARFFGRVHGDDGFV